MEAALAAVRAIGAAEELGHHRFHGRALRQGVAMTSVRGGHVVVFSEVDAHPAATAFLSGRQMQRAADVSLRQACTEGGDTALRSSLRGVFEGANARHGAVEGERPVGHSQRGRLKEARV
jgi:hypothetical protein